MDIDSFRHGGQYGPARIPLQQNPHKGEERVAIRRRETADKIGLGRDGRATVVRTAGMRGAGTAHPTSTDVLAWVCGGDAHG